MREKIQKRWRRQSWLGLAKSRGVLLFLGCSFLRSELCPSWRSRWCNVPLSLPWILERPSARSAFPVPPCTFRPATVRGFGFSKLDKESTRGTISNNLFRVLWHYEVFEGLGICQYSCVSVHLSVIPGAFAQVVARSFSEEMKFKLQVLIEIDEKHVQNAFKAKNIHLHFWKNRKKSKCL